MNTLKASVIFCILLSSLHLKAEVLRWPQACLTGELQITNLTAVDLRIWLQKFKSSLISETEFNLKANGVMKYTLKATSSAERYSILNLNGLKTISAQLICNKKIYPAHNFEGGNLTYRRTDLATAQIWLQNLFNSPNTVTLEFQNRQFQTLNKVSLNLKAMAKTTYSVPTKVGTWTYLKVSGSARFAAFNFNSAGGEGPFLVNPQPSMTDSQASYFIVAPRSGNGDSYVAKISDSAMVARAREQISNPQLEKIVFGRIQKGAAGFNRNWSKTEKSFWSWSVSEITSFGDVGSTYCNGLPQALEDRTDSWVKSPGQICFWGYRIKKELTADEVASGQQIQ